jgi:hypothetical protein
VELVVTRSVCERFALRSLSQMSCGSRLLAFATAALCAGFSTHINGQFEKQISPTFDGWNRLPDGSFELVYGYMNRNTTEIAIPLGADNRLDPAPDDRGQPTNFLPGRQRNAFRIHVPADFKGKIVWTVRYADTVQTAGGSIDQNYSLDVGDPEPPSLKGGPDLTVRASEPAQLKPVVAPPPKPQEAAGAEIVARRSSGQRILVWWSKFRGPGNVTFGDGKTPATSAPGPAGRDFPLGSFRLECTAPLSASCGSTTAHFSEPGTYWLRVVAAERSASNAIVKVTVTP